MERTYTLVRWPCFVVLFGYYDEEPDTWPEWSATWPAWRNN